MVVSRIEHPRWPIARHKTHRSGHQECHHVKGLTQHRRVTESGGDTLKALADTTFPNPEPGASHAELLPTTTQGLRSALVDGYDAATLAETPGGILLWEITALTSSYALPPDVISAIWDTLADEPSVTLLGTALDRRGREALVFSAAAADGYSQQLLLADPETGAILGDELVLVESSPAYSFTPPAVTSFNTIVRSERIALEDVPPEN